MLERLFGTLTKALGYKICGFDRNKEFEVIGVLGHWWHFVYQKKITKRNYMQIKVLKLPKIWDLYGTLRQIVFEEREKYDASEQIKIFFEINEKENLKNIDFEGVDVVSGL